MGTKNAAELFAAECHWSARTEPARDSEEEEASWALIIDVPAYA